MTERSYRYFLRRDEDHRAALDRAVRLLIGDSGGRYWYRRAAREIVRLACGLPETSSRPQELSAATAAKWLRNIEKQSGRLRAAIADADDFFGCYPDALLDPPVKGLTAVTYPWRRLQDGDPDPEKNRSALCAELMQMEALCRQLAGSLKDGRGGRRTLHHRTQPAPKSELVRAAAELFLRYRRDDLTMTEGGDFYAFCSDLHEVVWERPGDESGVGLKPYVEQTVPVMKEIVRFTQIAENQRVQNEGRPIAAASPEECERVRKVLSMLHEEVRNPRTSRRRK